MELTINLTLLALFIKQEELLLMSCIFRKALGRPEEAKFIEESLFMEGLVHARLS